MGRTWERNANVKEGSNIIDPPVIRYYEQRLADAQGAADDTLIAIVTADYNAERERIVGLIEDAENSPDDLSDAAAVAAVAVGDATIPDPEADDLETNANPDATTTTFVPEKLTGTALAARAAELGIDDTKLTADETRAAIATKEGENQ